LNALSIDIEPENLGRLAGDFSPKSEGSKNTNLFDGDAIFIPKNPNVISVLGEVLNPIAFEYSKGLSLNSAIELAGGYKQFADKRRVYVIKANGIVEKPKRNIYIGSSGLQPGDTIVVPRKIILSNSGLNALIPVTQLLSDLAFSAAALDNLSN
jgi:protein involved in polysaccharide export with SLBB domain